MQRTAEKAGVTSISDVAYVTAYSILIVVLMLLWAN